MADSLVLRLHDGTDDCEWVVVDADGRQTERRREGRLSDVRAYATGRRLIVLVPGGTVVTTRAELPQVSKARLRQMLPFALEDQFAEDVASLHFAAGSRNDAGELYVSVVARDRLEEWLARLEAADLAPTVIYADTDGVADTPSTLNVVVENDTIFARLPGDAALSIEGLELDDAFAMVTDAGDGQTTIQHALLCIDAAARERNAGQIEALSQRFSGLDIRLLQDDALPMFATKLINHPGANLLQGPYAPRSNWGAMLKPWRVAAVLATVLIVTVVLGTVIDYTQLRRTEATLTDTLEARCSAEFRAAGLSQCEAEVQARLRSLGEVNGGGEEFLATLARVAETTDSTNTMRTLSYRNSVMDVQIVTPDIPALDEFSRRLDEAGPFTVQVQSTNPQEDGRVESRVQIVGENR
ncbi:MAG: type II secretion system protein GspL [Gammaproteobacteria bacterium]|jgi:general secretion pathway protein L